MEETARQAALAAGLVAPSVLLLLPHALTEKSLRHWRSAELEGHGDLGAGEGVGVLGAVDAPAVDLVDDLGLGDFLEPQGAEEAGLEGQDDGLRGLEAVDALEDEADEAFADAAAAPGLADGNGLELDGGAFGAADLGENLPAGAGDELVAAGGDGETVDVLDDVVDGLEDELVRVALDQAVDGKHVLERGAADDNVVGVHGGSFRLGQRRRSCRRRRRPGGGRRRGWACRPAG